MSRTKALLDKAKGFESERRFRGGPPTAQEIELAAAWLRGEITALQANHAMGNKPHRATGTYTSILRRAAMLRLLTVTVVKP